LIKKGVQKMALKRIYLASPYSHSDSAITEARNLSVCKVAGKIMNQGHIVYSPIAHSHSIATVCNLPTDWSFWKHVDEEFIKWADEVWILTLPGWNKSTGIEAEVLIADKLGKEVKYLDPKDV
jgi:hypothetical protein